MLKMNILNREFIFLYRKVLIIFLIGYTKISSEAQSMFVLLILFVMLWQQARDNPYFSDDLNSVDFKATLVAFCTIFGGLCSFVTQNDVITILVIISILFGNILFIIIWLRRMLILKSNELLKLKYLQFCRFLFLKLNLRLIFIFFFSIFIISYFIEYDSLTSEAYRFIRNLPNGSQSQKCSSPISRLKNSQKKTIFSKFKYALSKISQKGDSFAYPSKDVTSKRDRDRVSNVLGENNMNDDSNNFSFNEISKRIELCNIIIPNKTDPNNYSDNNSNRIIMENNKCASEKIKNLEEENKKLKKSIEELKSLLNLKNKFIKRLEGNLSHTKNDLSDLEKFTDQLKADLDYFQKKNKKLDDIKSIKIQKNQSYFNDEVKPNAEECKKIRENSEDFEKNNKNFEIKEDELISCWLAQAKPFKYYTPKITLHLIKNIVSLATMKTSIFALKVQIKNNTFDEFDEITAKITFSSS